MNFEYNDEQKMLKESMQRWFQDNHSFEQRQVIVSSKSGFQPEHWNTFAELGWLSIPFTEDFGGYGGSIIDVAAMMEEFGKALVTAPVLSNLVMFGGILQKAGGDAAGETITGIIDGSTMGAVASYEPSARFDLSNVQTTAKKGDGGYIISGVKTMVLGAPYASKFVVSARTSGDVKDEAGISLFTVDAKAAGVTTKPYVLMDGQHVADVHFENVSVKSNELLGDKDNGYVLLDAVLQDADVALAAEALGIMQTLNAMTVEYTKTRKQFGIAISNFQALQHRMVDCFMACEQTKSLLYGTLCELTDGITPAEEARQTVLALRTLVARYGKQVGDEAIQMHGGMGMTDELSVGHYAKRLMMINMQFGSGDFYQKCYNQAAYGKVA